MRRLRLTIEANDRQKLAETLKFLAAKIALESVEFETKADAYGWHSFIIEDIECPKRLADVDPRQAEAQWMDEYIHTPNYVEVYGD